VNLPILARTGLVAGLLLLAACGQREAPPVSAPAGPAPAATTPAASNRPVAVLTKSGVPMVYLPGGEFEMGTDRGSPDEAPAHRVRLSPFLMDTCEVTHELFAKVQLPNPSHWQDNPRKPVERVRWRDAKQYCNERSLLEGLRPAYNEKTADWDCDPAANGYRLPTEAEWEFACRAGASTPYDFGPATQLRAYGWFADNADRQTHPVGQKRPNRWGLHDLYGNVAEWCEDVYHPNYYRESPADNPPGPASPGRDVRRVIRGGSWRSSADACRATFRQGEKTGDTDACFSTDYCGFRCVRRVTPEELDQLRAPAK
jgi:formylglycine-generating enzyme required for sulfatase activity